MLSNLHQFFRGDVGFLTRLVRMGSDGAVYAVIGLSDFFNLLELADASTDGDHQLDASLVGALDDLVAFFCEIRKIQMTMTIN